MSQTKLMINERGQTRSGRDELNGDESKGDEIKINKQTG